MWPARWGQHGKPVSRTCWSRSPSVTRPPRRGRARARSSSTNEAMCGSNRFYSGLFGARAIKLQRKGYRPQILLTSLVDENKYTASGLRTRCHERWEIELGLGEIKTDMLERLETIRSKSPRPVAQERWGADRLEPWLASRRSSACRRSASASSAECAKLPTSGRWQLGCHQEQFPTASRRCPIATSSLHNEENESIHAP